MHEKLFTKENLIESLGSLVKPGGELEGLIERLEKSGYFNAPASTRYHGAYPGGLLDHSMTMMMYLLRLTGENQLVWEKPRSPYVIGLLHDMCKYDAYVVGENGKISWNKNQRIKGHGEKSARIAKILIPDLTEEEEDCIRYHMGAFCELPKGSVESMEIAKQWAEYTEAVHRHENVLWTHQADMLAAHVANT